MEKLKQLADEICADGIKLLTLKEQCQNQKELLINIELMQEVAVLEAVDADGKKMYSNDVKRKIALKQLLDMDANYQQELSKLVSYEHETAILAINISYKKRLFKYHYLINKGAE